MSVCEHNKSLLAYHDDNCGDDQPRVHALAIGISKYAKPRRAIVGTSFRQLQGAALAAGRFARYLINEFRDPDRRSLGTVRLLVSPLGENEESELSSLVSREATRLEAELALQDWAIDCDSHDKNLAILYIAGHGVALGTGVSTFFLADALQQGNKYMGSINVTAVATQMGDCSAKDNIYVYDCCALPPRGVPDMHKNGGTSLDTELFAQPEEGKKKKRRETAVYISAARIGWSTYAIGERGTLLSRGLLGAFKERTGEDALLVTAGQIIDNRYYGITTYRLNEDLPFRMMDLIRERGGDAEGYEPSVTVDRGPPRPLAVPDPPPTFTVVLNGLHEGRVRPVKVLVQTAQGNPVREEQDVPDEYALRDLPAGQYYAHVSGGDGSLSTPYPLVVDRPRIIDLLPRE